MVKLVLAAFLLAAGYVVFQILRGQASRYGALAPSHPQYAVAQRAAKALRFWARTSLIAGAALHLLVVVLSTFIFVSTGHVAVVTEFGKVLPTPLYEGFNLVLPWRDVHQMSVQIKKKEGKFDAGSKDLQSVHVIMVTNYRLQAKSVPTIFKDVGYDFEQVIIAPAEQEVLKAHTARFAAAEILHERPRLKGEIQQDLTAWLAKYGVELKETSLANIRFDPAYEKAVESKQLEEQKAEQKRYELVQAQRQAEIVAANAKGKADGAREEAKGEADALRFKGQAQAEYNTKVSASLTQTLIQQQWITAWQTGGAQVPHYFLDGAAGNGNVGFLMQMPTGGKPAKPVQRE